MKNSFFIVLNYFGLLNFLAVFMEETRMLIISLTLIKSSLAV